MQTGAQCTMTSTPTPKNVRLTITVTPEVHAVFQRLSKGTGMSLSRAMGEWLGDTVEAAEFMASKVEQARAAPSIVMREMHAYALGMADEANTLMEDMKKKGLQDRANARAKVIGSGRSGDAHAPRPGPIRSRPPSSNTGGKGQGQRQAKGGKVL